jgi:hypothetical protein
MHVSRCILPLIIFSLVSAGNAYSQQEDSLVINYCYINSIPQNAHVYLNDTLIGQTPVRFSPGVIDTTGKSKIVIKLDGYYDYVLTVEKESLPLNKTIYLTAQAGKVTSLYNHLVMENEDTYFKSPRKILPIAVSAVIALGSGILSYYFKQQANNKYDEYQNTGDPSLLDKKRKYDIISGISLAVFQIGLAGLIYFLIME